MCECDGSLVLVRCAMYTLKMNCMVICITNDDGKDRALARQHSVCVYVPRNHKINYQMFDKQQRPKKMRTEPVVSNIFQSSAGIRVDVDIICSDWAFVSSHFAAMYTLHCTTIHAHGIASPRLKITFRNISTRSRLNQIEKMNVQQWKIREIILIHALNMSWPKKNNNNKMANEMNA